MDRDEKREKWREREKERNNRVIEGVCVLANEGRREKREGDKPPVR